MTKAEAWVRLCAATAALGAAWAEFSSALDAYRKAKSLNPSKEIVR